MKFLLRNIIVFGVALLVIQPVTADDIKVGDFYISCESDGVCSPGGEPSFECTITLGNRIIKRTHLAPTMPTAKIIVTVDSAELAGSFASTYGQVCEVSANLNAMGPKGKYIGTVYP
ncbi:MAG: hypothetical protein PHY93_16175 [Bacteriovorax sp.]|nr:hypothetical protein [Bacteriovorax sp.]